MEFLAEEDFTHVELHPVMEYLDDITGGYSTYAYYAPTSRFGSVADFQKLVDELHQAGIGVILDWTPAQFPRYALSLIHIFGATTDAATKAIRVCYN